MIEIIPAIDIIEGKCVRLTQGDFGQKTKYHDNPVEVAKAFEDAGIRRLHLVDLDGARQKHIVADKNFENLPKSDFVQPNIWKMFTLSLSFVILNSEKPMV